MTSILIKRWEKMVWDLFQNNDTIMTHCNAGALATVGYGTALGVIRATKGKWKKHQSYCYGDKTSTARF